ncbi:MULTISPECIES: hypothetical protein [Staphylococcus]|uniref:hypothetical protein n=1 Tax=Staphylococcus TaxID=1279 RepID=UPI0002FA0C01|nr:MULTISPECIES: hypothetical protein [Staphylococcus]AYX84263.1 hypothetical protein EGX85_08110 [Staphylococcus haemolyticus]MBW3857450.1 hypothetical protein [Staphylococcus haemolyticus]MCH4418917.1 hypothetical protein [Staphylococcus haemolyticus]MCH4505646.1 hypothetical protein [Staphylococcus haemolyticus]MCH4512757.1 hypothetical protein [Staphylococcus haemolyticus]
MNKATASTSYKQTKSNAHIISIPALSNKPSSSSKQVIHYIKSITKVQPTTTKQKPKTTAPAKPVGKMPITKLPAQPIVRSNTQTVTKQLFLKI